ncbi:MAG TPA: hypothetical protein VMU62_06240 [Acidobacteriaceae bacterium]|nr:hypothetical protein [Acidobacteriaceae bacterium]
MAQQKDTPQLQQRSQDSGYALPAPVDKAAAASQRVSTLPEDVSGAYAFDRTGESIEIDIDRGKLTGYISRLGDVDTDSGTPLTYFFDHTALDGGQLRFETKVVHGVWYSFTGTIVRGAGETRDKEGYYVLRGKLQVHHPRDTRDKSSEETVEQRSVSYKSLGQ